MLLGQNGELKIADFGWAIKVENNKYPYEICGTLDYISPEIVNGSTYNEKVGKSRFFS